MGQHEAATAARDDVLEAVLERIARHALPIPEITSTRHGAVLAATGAFPLDDLLAWAGQMSAPEPAWWTIRRLDRSGLVDVYAAGSVDGLGVTIAAATREALPLRPHTEDVVGAAARERGPWLGSA